MPRQMLWWTQWHKTLLSARHSTRFITLEQNKCRRKQSQRTNEKKSVHNIRSEVFNTINNSSWFVRERVMLWWCWCCWFRRSNILKYILRPIRDTQNLIRFMFALFHCVIDTLQSFCSIVSCSMPFDCYLMWKSCFCLPFSHRQYRSHSNTENTSFLHFISFHFLALYSKHFSLISRNVIAWKILWIFQ